ncbi:MAG: GNAT family N-acetyltransferase [Rhizobiales bacterium]|nr:GNAT family N-acetyltransferase [Hyphomicrobiales bacterium]
MTGSMGLRRSNWGEQNAVAPDQATAHDDPAVLLHGFDAFARHAISTEPQPPCTIVSMLIVEFTMLTKAQLQRAAEILVEAFAHAPSAWKTIADADAEVSTFLDDPDRLGLAAVDQDRLLGWIGGLKTTPQAWELHPLAVDPKYQRRGAGSLLISTLEESARKDGIETIWLGSDDDFGGTSLYGVDVYPDVLRHLARLAATKGHPFTFYRKHGYCVVGILPDVNGFGKPDILMAKRLRAR